MEPLRISAVSYLNTIPYVYGIINSGNLTNFRLDLDVPSICAEKLKTGEVDIALVPVGAIPELTNTLCISDYCIGAVRDVRTVLLLSQQPLEKITRIFLDFDSRTSVQLARVLAKEFWKIEPEWENLRPGQAEQNNHIETLVAIGDKTFELSKKYKYVYDLAEEWIRFTTLPFVFAAWMSAKPLTPVSLESFNQALAYGVAHKAEALSFFKDKLPACGDCLSYLENNISYLLDGEKRKGMQLFLKLIRSS
jgi:chorismate dehydratase